jgi:hypothetical protein
MIDEYQVLKILVAQLRNRPFVVDFFMLNVFGGQELL